MPRSPANSPGSSVNPARNVTTVITVWQDGKGGTTISAVVAHHVADRRATRQSLGIVHALVSAQASKQRSARQTGWPMPRVLASTQIRQRRPGDLGQPESFVQRAVGRNPSVRGDLAALEFQLQAAVEIDPRRSLSWFTRRVRQAWSDTMMIVL